MSFRPGKAGGSPRAGTLLFAFLMAAVSAPPAALAASAPLSVPGAPTAVTASAGPASALVAWSAPASAGTSAITGYSVSSSPAAGGCQSAADTTSCVPTGLTKGVAYAFAVTATNDVGTSVASDLSNTITPATDDTDPPKLVSSTVDPASVDVTTSAQTVTITARLLDFNGVASARVALQDRSTNSGVESQVLTRVSGSAADGTWTATLTVPQYVRFSDLAVSVSASDTAMNGNTVDAGSVAVTGASNDTTPPAISSPSVTPTSVDVTDNVAQVNIALHVADVGTGVHQVFAYVHQVNDTRGSAPLALTSGTPSSGTWSGDILLGTTTPAGQYTVQVMAIDQAGNSTQIDFGTIDVLNAHSDSTAPELVGDVQGTPTSVDLSNSSQKVAVTAHLRDVGTGVNVATVWTTATYTASPAAANLTLIDGTTSDGTWSGTLDLPAHYRHGDLGMYVQMTDHAFNQGISLTTTKITVLDVAPAAPASVSATSNAPGAVDVAWDAPPDNGGSPIDSFAITAAPVLAGSGTTTSTTVVSTLRAVSLTGLTSGVNYAISVRAKNVIGDSPAAASTATTIAVPGSVTGALAVAGNASATVSWTAPSSNGGSPISAYTVTGSPGGASATVPGASSAALVTGLSNGTAYTFTVTATNTVGTSPASAPSGAVTPIAPDTTAPVISIASGPNTVTNANSALFGFTGSDPGGAGAGLVFRCRLDAAAFAGCTSPRSLTGLSDGPHTFQVLAVDAGNASAPVSRTWRVDTILPTLTTSATPLFTLGSIVGLHYTGVDGGSGVGSYDVRYRRAPWNGTFEALTYPSVAPTDWTATTASTVSLTTVKGYTYCLSARARDKAGNLSGWTPERCTATALDDRSLTASTTGWTRATGTGYYAGTITSTTRSGAVLTRTGVQARRLSLVATRCPGCGTVGVYWNGTLIRKIVLNSTTTAHKQLFTITDFGTIKTGTLTIKTLTTGSTRIDGLATSRS